MTWAGVMSRLVGGFWRRVLALAEFFEPRDPLASPIKVLATTPGHTWRRTTAGMAD